MLSGKLVKKKDQWKGKLSKREFKGNHFITLEMSRPQNEAEMYFIFEYLLGPWIGKNVIIDIRLEESEEQKKEPVHPPSIQKEWLNKFRKMGVV